MNSFSPNMLKTFKTCPKKYEFKYIQNISVPQKSSLFEKGKKVHALASYYLRGFDTTKLETNLTEQEKIVWESLKQNEYFQKTYVSSEYSLSCKIGGFWVGGRLDAVVKDENFYYILDYKTGSAPQNAEYDFQTMVYLTCAGKKFGKNIKFVYIDLKNRQNIVIDYLHGEEYEKILQDFCGKISSDKFKSQVTKHCEICEYKKLCTYKTRA